MSHQSATPFRSRASDLLSGAAMISGDASRTAAVTFGITEALCGCPVDARLEELWRTQLGRGLSMDNAKVAVEADPRMTGVPSTKEAHDVVFGKTQFRELDEKLAGKGANR